MRRFLIYALLSVLVLAACQESEPEPVPQLAPPTQPPNDATARPTVIITLTPRPTEAQSIADADYITYYGTWNLLARYDLLNTQYKDQLAYTTNVTINIDEDGIITGTGAFVPVLGLGRCYAEPTNFETLGFTIEGSLIADSTGSVSANMQYIPDNANFRESYTILCTDRLDGSVEQSTVTATILWDVLQASDQMNYMFSIGDYRSSLVPDIDLNQLTGGRIDGNLIGDIYFSQ